MALKSCIECNHEISTEAKICPNCGARNRDYKSRGWEKLLILAVICIFGLAGFVYYILTENEDISNCDTSGNRESFSSVINESSYSQLNKLKVVDILNIETIESGESMTDLVCDADINFNSKEITRFRFSWELSESGTLLILAQPKPKKRKIGKKK